MSKKPTTQQVDAWRAMNLACGAMARAIYHMAKAEGMRDVPQHAEVLRELYDAADAVRDAIEREWPGVTGHASF